MRAQLLLLVVVTKLGTLTRTPCGLFGCKLRVTQSIGHQNQISFFILDHNHLLQFWVDRYIIIYYTFYIPKPSFIVLAYNLKGPGWAKFGNQVTHAFRVWDQYSMPAKTSRTDIVMVYISSKKAYTYGSVIVTRKGQGIHEGERITVTNVYKRLGYKGPGDYFWVFCTWEKFIDKELININIQRIFKICNLRILHNAKLIVTSFCCSTFCRIQYRISQYNLREFCLKHSGFASRCAKLTSPVIFFVSDSCVICQWVVGIVPTAQRSIMAAEFKF